MACKHHLKARQLSKWVNLTILRATCASFCDMNKFLFDFDVVHPVKHAAAAQYAA